MVKPLLPALLIVLAVSNAAEVKEGVAAKNIQAVKFRSESLGEDRMFNILTPNDYDTSTSRYPVLYLLHGYGDDHTAWSLMTNVSGYASRHKIIIVMPDGSRSFYVNSAADPKSRFEDLIVKDLIPYVDSHYRTIPLPRTRAVAGLSMGGYGAAFLALKHANQFAAFGSFSGAVGIVHFPDSIRSNSEEQRRRFETMQALFGKPDSPDRQDRDPFALLDKVPAGQMPAIYIACGGEDFLVEKNRAFVKELAAKKIPYEYHEISPREHEWGFWDEQIRVFLDFLDRHGFGRN